VPTKYKGLFAELGPYGKKVDLRRGNWSSQRKMGVAMHLFEIINLGSGIEMLMSALNFFRETMVLLRFR